MAVLDAFCFYLRGVISSPLAEPHNVLSLATGGWMNQFHYTADAPVDYEVIATVLWELFKEKYQHVLGARAWAYACTVQEVPGDFPSHVEHFEAFDAYRGITGDVLDLPNQCCVLLQKKTATAGRAGRGCVFVGPVNHDVFTIDVSGLNTQNDRVADDHDGLNELAEFVKSPQIVGGALITPCLYSRIHQTLTPLVDCRVMNVMAALRSRRTFRRDPFPVT